MIKLLELVGSDGHFTSQRMDIINTVSVVFNIAQPEHKLIESFVISKDTNSLDFPNILLANSDHQGDPEKNISTRTSILMETRFHACARCGHAIR